MDFITCKIPIKFLWACRVKPEPQAPPAPPRDPGPFFVPKEECEHLSVTTHLIKYTPGTRFEPPEVEGWAVCDNDNCRKAMDLQDIPEGSEIVENYD